MKNYLFISLSILISTLSYSQESVKQRLLKEMSNNVCKCIDSIPLTANLSSAQIREKIKTCIDDKAGAYQMGVKLMAVDKSEKSANIEVNVNKDSKEYKDYYYEMEKYLLGNCKAMKIKMAENNKQSDKSLTNNIEAQKNYNLGIDATKKENYKEALGYFKKAVKADPNFAFGYDNLGITYRMLNDYDNAINAYEKSLKIDPNGTMPLQNIAVAYQYKKEYQKAVGAYLQLAKLDPQNPEVFYGIGQTYAFFLNDLDKGLDYLCKAYNIYTDQSSPYRSDAQTLIQNVYNEMKKQGKLDNFKAILKNNNINME